MRKAGVLMPVSALPSRIGAGELGESAFQFIELLKENHVIPHTSHIPPVQGMSCISVLMRLQRKVC